MKASTAPLLRRPASCRSVIDEAAVGRRLLAAHESTLAAVVAAADDVAADPAVPAAVAADSPAAAGSGPEAEAVDGGVDAADDGERTGRHRETGAESDDEPPDDARAPGRAVAAALEAALADRAVLDDAPALLKTAVAAADRTLPTTPVAAPPYVVVGSTGLLCRATLSESRLLVRIAVFEPRRLPLRYVRTAATPTAALSVSLVE